MTAAGPYRRELALFLVALCLSAALPFCSPAYTAEQKKPSAGKDRSPPSPPLAAPQAVDVGRRSSAVFPVFGNVYPNGLYYASLSIGDPPKPYFLDVDTGSELTWVQCDAPCISCSKGPHPLYKPTKDKLVPCGHPLCGAIQETADPKTYHPGDSKLQGCDSPKDQCDYEVEYADHGSSRGVLISDAFSIRFLNGSLLRPRLAFGCGYDQQLYRPGSPAPTDGVLGLGSGGSTIMSQLRQQGLTRNVLGHCLSRKGGGFLFFGDDLVPRSGITWTPMSRRASRKYYSPGPANLFFGGQHIVKNLQVILDSGSSYTYFSSRLYEAILQLVLKDLAGKPLKVAPEEHTLPRCWKGAKPFKSIADVRSYFKPLALSFTQGKRAQLDIPPESYLIITKEGNVCLGFLDGTEAGLQDFNIIGDISMQDLVVVYDNEKGQIGWARANCDVLPNAGRDGGFEGGLCPAQFLSASGVLTPEFAATYTSWTI